MMFLGGIQTGRQLNEGEVRAVNYIIKKRARKFIAGGQAEWLYPEDVVKTKTWSNLGGEFFLRPDPRSLGFRGEMYVRMKDGTAWGMDEFGQSPNNDHPARKAQRDMEWDYYVKSMTLWDKKRRPITNRSMP